MESQAKSAARPSTTEAPSERGIGDNKPPDLLETLAEDHAPLRHEIEKLADRANSTPHEIKSEADLDAIGTLLKDTRELARKAEKERTTTKEPYLVSGRTVDQYFKTLTDRLVRIGDVFQKIADKHARAVAAAARAKADADAKAAREEAARREAAARKAEEDNRKKNAETHAAKADVALQAAEAAEAVAAAPVKELVQTMTASGLSAGAKDNWTFEIVDFSAIDLNKLRPLFKRDAVEAAIRQAVRNGEREIAGVRVYKEVKATFR
jgi:hypothetical protein